ncbi:Agamous-like MADS-box protein AGL61 [Abeliophyllum distichum]|uniref:Agamous-like MADS-box protein AGL61 n=1 Tax=Abeliophyllum distichum TaxID=126358 RepID=A0ABD1P9M9_9LAMI
MNATVCELNLQLGHILNELEVETKRGETLDHMIKSSQSHYWWESPVNKLGLHELEQLRNAVEELTKTVTTQAGKLISEVTNPSSFFESTGAGVFDQYESKPTHDQVFIVSSTAPVNHNFGYCHGFF